MKMRCEKCGYTGEKINFMKLNTEDKSMSYVDTCPECASPGPLVPLDEEAGEMHDQAQALADRIFEEQRQNVASYEVPEDTLISEEELKNLNLDEDD